MMTHPPAASLRRTARPLRRLTTSRARLTPLLALVLVLATAATALGLPIAARDPQRPAHPAAAAVGAVSPAPAIVGDDACGLLTDEELLLATGGTAIAARIPGSQLMLAAGCQVEIEPRGDAFGTTWTVYLGVQPTGGKARYAQDEEYAPGTPIAGIGDRASHQSLLDAWSALTGDTYVTLQVTAFGGDRPRSTAAMGRLLLWRVVTRLEAAGVEPAPTPSPSPAPLDPTRALVERLRAPVFGQDAIDAAVELFARSGIATYASPDDPEPIVPVTAPESPMMLLLDQVRAMALEAWSGAGFSGADLDALVPAKPDLAGGAEIVAAYVSAVETDGAAVARELLGDNDLTRPERLVVPQLVLMLLVSDIARERQASAAATGRAAPHPVRTVALAIRDGARTAQGGVCSAVLGFINNVMTRVFDALRLGEPSGTVGKVLVTIWNFVVDIAEAAARKIVKQLTQPVLDLIAEVAATVGLAAMIVSTIRPWTLSVTADPPVTAKGVGGSPGQPGQFVAHVDLGGLDKWPDAVQDCATVAGRPLPNLKPEGAPATWSVIGQQPGDLVIEGHKETRLDADGTARFPFTTGVDTLPEPWQDRPGWVGVSVRVDRPQLEQLRQMAIDELLAQIPSIVRGPLVPLVRPILDRLTAQLDTLLSSQSSGVGTVIYHVPADTPNPDEPAPTPPARAVVVQLDRPASRPALAGRVVDLVSCSGPYGAWSGVIRLGGLSSEGVEVPFADFPLAFAFPGTGGIRTTSTSIAGTVDTNVPNLSYDIAADLWVVTDGKTLTFAGQAVGSTIVFSVGVEFGGGQLRDLPIRPAPAGTCP